MKEGIDFNPDSFFVRSSRGYSADGRGDAAVATWIVREGESRRRRGRDVDSPSRRRPAAAAATWIVAEAGARQVPDAAIVTEDNMSAAITIRFAEKNGSTTLFAAQFVALDKPTEDNDLYTMVRLRSGSLDAAAPRNGSTSTRSTPRLRGTFDSTQVLRVYTDDEKTEASLQPTHGEGHSCFDPSAPHFHMYSPRGGRDKRVRIAAACGRETGRSDAAACGRAAPRPRDGRGPTRGDAAARGCAALSMRSATAGSRTTKSSTQSLDRARRLWS